MPLLRWALTPAAWLTRVVKSRPRGIFSISSSRRLVARELCVIATRGDSLTTSIVSVTLDGSSFRSTRSSTPSFSSTSTTRAGAKPDSRATTSYRPGGREAKR